MADLLPMDAQTLAMVAAAGDHVENALTFVEDDKGMVSSARAERFVMAADDVSGPPLQASSAKKSFQSLHSLIT